MKKRYLLIFLLLFTFNISKTSNRVCNSVELEPKNSYKLVDDIEYEETLEEIDNPERGFYNHINLVMKETGSRAANSGANLVHIRTDIGDFSKANNGVADKEISQDALDALDMTLKNIKNNGGSVIIRFTYDGYRGEANKEPSLDMILRHIEQVGAVITANKDVMAFIELGFFGKWGEMHSSTICTLDNFKIALDKMLDVTPEELIIGVRTPRYYAHWAGIDIADIDKNVTLPGERAYRVGIYNDGYLGNESDLGTYINREKEIKWIEKQATHTLYGGEVVDNFASGEPLNTVAYMSREAFRTHTSHLNIAWNPTTISKWRTEIYREEGSIYDGKTGFLYVNNHLGYRYVLRESNIDDEIYENGQIKIKFKVENVGFANMINEKKTTLLLVKDDVVKEIETDIDVREWNSRENKEVELIVNVPEDIDIGEYKAYLRISKYGDLESDNNYQVVKMANKDIWSEEYGANYIGEIKVLEEKTYTINYYLDNVKFDEFTKTVKGKGDTLKETYLKEIENYKFIRVEVKDNEINYYYEGIVKNPNTIDTLNVIVIILSLIVIVFSLYRLYCSKKYDYYNNY